MLDPSSSGSLVSPGGSQSQHRSGSRSGGVTRVAPGAVCSVLREDPDLAAALPRAERVRAMDECTAPVLRIRRGCWSDEEIEMAGGGIGLLVLQGLLIRRVGVDGRFGAELLGDGDLLRPWQGEDAQIALRYKTDWRVLEPTRVAVLDRRIAERLARYPELIEGLVGRALDRSRELAVNLAIVQHPRVDVRLLMLLWHLADRWGRVGRDGLHVPLRLTHAALGELVAARRPTVSRALSELAEQGLVRAVEDVWLLSGEPPRELLTLPAVRQADRSVAAQQLGSESTQETGLSARRRDGCVGRRHPRGGV